jgi:hypothetical protein
MEAVQVTLAVPSSLFMLAKKLPVHGDEQLLAVLAEAPIAADSLDHIQAGLVVPACDRQVAEHPRQRTGLQLQGTLQVRDLGRNGQRTPTLPLRRRRLADARSATKRVQRQPSSDARLPKDSAELLLLRCGRQGPCSQVGAASAGSIAYLLGRRVRPLHGPSSLLDESSSMLYDMAAMPYCGKCRHG